MFMFVFENSQTEDVVMVSVGLPDKNGKCRQKAVHKQVNIIAENEEHARRRGNVMSDYHLIDQIPLGSLWDQFYDKC